MQVKVQVIIESDTGQRLVEEVASLVRNTLSAETLGLSLAEAKEILQHLQASVVNQQISKHLQEQRHCPNCGAVRSLKSYGLTVDLLAEVLPLGGQINTRTVRRQLQRVAERTERDLGSEEHVYIEGCPRDWGQLLRPGAPITVGIDGGYVRGRQGKSRSTGHFEVIAGKSIADDASKCFAFVSRSDKKPKRRLFEVLKSQAEHILDWFHVTTRLTVMRQTAKGLPLPENGDGTNDVIKKLESIKWYLWHGNVFRALEKIEFLQMDIEDLDETEAQSKLLKALSEVEHYMESDIEMASALPPAS
jgi:hypothetical protein